MAGNIKELIELIKLEGFDVTNWQLSNRRIYKVLDLKGNEVSGGMYSNELRAWFRGYLIGCKIK